MGLLWTLFALVITIINGVNAFSSKGIATHEIVIEDDYNVENDYNQEKNNNTKTSEERLNELQIQYEKNVITEDEYDK